MRLMAHTSCFRREAGSAGRDTRVCCGCTSSTRSRSWPTRRPSQSAAIHDEILHRAESIIRDLGLAYRIVDICAGDIGGSSKRTWDIEVYAPGVDRWLEVSSVSWFGDYQARRANIRYRPAGQKGTQVVHTLNGSALAVPRVWAALVETAPPARRLDRAARSAAPLPARLHRFVAWLFRCACAFRAIRFGASPVDLSELRATTSDWEALRRCRCRSRSVRAVSPVVRRGRRRRLRRAVGDGAGHRGPRRVAVGPQRVAAGAEPDRVRLLHELHERQGPRHRGQRSGDGSLQLEPRAPASAHRRYRRREFPKPSPRRTSPADRGAHRSARGHPIRAR